MEYVTLNSSVKMPMAGIGTFLLTPDEAESFRPLRAAMRLSPDRHGERLRQRKGRGPRDEEIRSDP